LIIEVKYACIGIILSPYLMDLVVFQYLYGGFDEWPINTEFLGDDRAIFRVEVFSVAWDFNARFQTCPEILTERRGIMYVSENLWSWKG